MIAAFTIGTSENENFQKKILILEFNFQLGKAWL